MRTKNNETDLYVNCLPGKLPEGGLSKVGALDQDALKMLQVPQCPHTSEGTVLGTWCSTGFIYLYFGQWKPTANDFSDKKRKCVTARWCRSLTTRSTPIRTKFCKISRIQFFSSAHRPLIKSLHSQQRTVDDGMLARTINCKPCHLNNS